MNFRIPFNRPCLVGSELEYVQSAIRSGHTCGNGPFTKRCQDLLEQHLGTPRALLTTSCTSALEMAALLCDFRPGDEVIMPSYTFVSTANAVALRGAKPVFVDIREDTLNLDERLIEAAITDRTRAIWPVHYAGVGCEMDEIIAIARRHGLRVVEDAAQGVFSKYKGRWLGTIGDIGCYSFHETKNFSCGEGGALLVNTESLAERAEIIREKGTNRGQFLRGQVDKYTWVDVGSSYVPADTLAGHLLGQLEGRDIITEHRRAVWTAYRTGFATLEAKGLVRLPRVPSHCDSNYHMFYLLTGGIEERTALMECLKTAGILAVFHYVPLHSAPMGNSLGSQRQALPVTESMSQTLVRLPLFVDLQPSHVAEIVSRVYDFYGVAASEI